MRVCSGCGKQLSDNAVTCSYCGYGFKEEKGPVQVDQQKVEEVTQKIQETTNKISRVVGIVMGIPFTLIGIFLLLGEVTTFINSKKYTVDVKGVYKDSINCELFDTEEYCDIVYKYEVDGKEYIYTELSVSEINFVGEIDLLYNIDNPEKSISKNSSSNSIISLIIGIVFVFVGMSAIFGKGKVKVSIG